MLMMGAGFGSAGDDDIVRLEPQVESDERHEAAQEQPCGGQEHQRERGGQHHLCPLFARRRPKPPAAGALASLRVRDRPGARRGGAEEKTGADRQGSREGEHVSVDTDLVESGHASRNHRGRGAHDRGGHGEAQRTAGRG